METTKGQTKDGFGTTKTWSVRTRDWIGCPQELDI